ncbi:hypothetical protein LOB39_02230 [Lactobacillus delbrueckii subsp. sunkii]|uniref:DUF2977 domain-containing protein n=1 Tax=Lactobacillus delbrueckii subsp. allosunkii TaxID=1050107 RepID=A0ABD4SA80_9LACO|nr:hypothetical protein [Lactobacillus delbrueckii]MCD5517394.1 hypothetical protein [Lactobacillus delbrueckii subsp. sunkii]MCT3475661.1 hypothetical protein [Lactobacillus delbrueckii subsp. lactis]
MVRYYLYDTNTGAYVGCMVASSQPENSTTLDPALTCHFNPYFESDQWLDKPLEVKPSIIKQLLMQQAQQITMLQSTAMQQNQSNTKLQAANAQQATQIKQLQQMVMMANQQQVVKKSKEINA